MALMSIGDFARASGLSAKALRIYDEMELLEPAEVDEANGYRYYEPIQLDRARLVARLRLIGMPLERIRAVTDLPASGRASELISYWRQVEADHASRRDQVALLVDQARVEGTGMIIEKSVRFGVASRIGQGHRDEQLDARYAGTQLLAVADGFGAEPSAAAAAVEVIGTYDSLSGVVDPVALLEEAVSHAAAAIGHTPGSGCTLTAVLVGADQVAVAHIGDSRVALVRHGRLQRLTRDHTFIQSLVDEGRLTEEEGRAHDDRVLLNRALVPDGGAAAAPDIAVHQVQTGDRLVLTTKGVHGVLPAALLADLVTASIPAEDVAAAIEAEVRNAGAPDNYAVVVADLS